MLSLVVALASTAMATDKLAYTLTFNTGSNNSNVSTNLSDYFSTESQAYVNGITASTSAIYGTAKGLQLGSAKKAGTFTFSLSDAGAVSATKIVVTAKKYNAKDNNSATFTIGSQEGTVTPTGTDDAAYEILLDGSKYLPSVYLRPSEFVLQRLKYMLQKVVTLLIPLLSLPDFLS